MVKGALQIKGHELRESGHLSTPCHGTVLLRLTPSDGPGCPEKLSAYETEFDQTLIHLAAFSEAQRRMPCPKDRFLTLGALSTHAQRLHPHSSTRSVAHLWTRLRLVTSTSCPSWPGWFSPLFRSLLPLLNFRVVLFLSHMNCFLMLK
jgi:hypothetical protein